MNRNFKKLLCKWIDENNEYHAVAINPEHVDFDSNIVYMNYGEVNGTAFTIAVMWSEIPKMSFDFFDMEY